MKVRLAQFEDVSEMVRIERANFKERAFSRQQFRHYVQESSAYYQKSSAYVAADGFVVFGYIVVFCRHNSATARINVVSVDPIHTGKGIGSMLLDEVEFRYHVYYDYMALEVNVENWRAIKLYKARGYEPKKILPDYYGEGTTGLKMIKKL
jgi:ribosomal protein S18 acetylase RimI-like enzyme